MEYVKLDVVDDWGYVYYCYAGKRIQCKADDTIPVCWPNGTETVEFISIKTISDEIYDMGHTNSIQYDKPYIITSHNGVDILIDMDKVMVGKSWVIAHSVQ